jgi:rare lipoprotein A
MTDTQVISLLSLIFTFVFTALILATNDSDYINGLTPIKDYQLKEKQVNSDSSVAKNTAAGSYKVKGKKYYTLSSKMAKGFIQTGLASWYGPGFHGKKTANGEIYNQNAMTAAHKTLPLSTMIKVTNLENMKSIIVRINDRGPYYGNRILDLSKKAADALGISKHGTGKIKLQVIS